jgi:hypothetical protein
LLPKSWLPGFQGGSKREWIEAREEGGLRESEERGRRTGGERGKTEDRERGRSKGKREDWGESEGRGITMEGAREE